MTDKLKKHIILHYKGQLEFDTISDLIHSLKEKMKERKVSFVIYKKVLVLMIEALENIIRYGEHFDGNSFIRINFPPEIQIYTVDGCFVLELSNAIQNHDIKKLNDRLVSLNELDKQSLKNLYKATITDGKFSDKGGAGLGIIEMAKLTDEKLAFKFSTINDQFSYFILKLFVKSANNDKIPE